MTPISQMERDCLQCQEDRLPNSLEKFIPDDKIPEAFSTLSWFITCAILVRLSGSQLIGRSASKTVDPEISNILLCGSALNSCSKQPPQWLTIAASSVATVPSVTLTATLQGTDSDLHNASAMKKIGKACLKYPEWKQKHNPHYKPWLFPEQSRLPSIPLSELSIQHADSLENIDESGLSEAKDERAEGSDEESTN
ncbi:STA10 protein, partial [Polypterus senegalus]